MKYEAAGCWPLPINDGNEYALVTKMQTSVIKAAYRQCPLSISLVRCETPEGVVLATSLKIADDPQAPLMLSGVLRHEEEQVAIENILRAKQTLMVFFDELSRPVARASCALADLEADEARIMLAEPGQRYVGSWSKLLSDVLDEVQGLDDPQHAVSVKYAPRIVCVPLTLSGFETNNISAVGLDDVLHFSLDDADEGHGLEQSTWHLLENLFGNQLIHSPQVRDGAVLRELTDILAFCNAGQCAFEAKAAAMLTTDLDRTTDRRGRSVRKQIDKGIDQLVGAIKNLAIGAPLFTKNGTARSVTAGMYRHGIVMVSEMLPSLNWEAIGAQLIAASKKSGAMLHVLDLQELRVLVGISRDQPDLFVAYLVHRFSIMQERKHALLRTRPAGPTLP